MRQVTLVELQHLAEDARNDVWSLAQDYGRDPKVYLHWSAGYYDTCFDDYHVNITGDGLIYVSTDNFADVLAHTYHRNSGAIGISLCCGYNCNSNDLGDYPPTAKQIETMAQAIDFIIVGLWLPIDKTHVMTHGEAADNEDGIEASEPYGPKTTCERWDLEFLGTDESPSFNPYATDGSRGGDVLRGKAIWYNQH